MQIPRSPIVVLDSGLGGLTVVSALKKVLPQEDIIYFGDTARLPYGSKSKPTIARFVREIIHYLRPFNPKHVVIACNTATALALSTMKTEFPDLAITGAIDPGARAAIEAAGSKRVPTIGIIATEATIRSKAYEHAIHRRRSHAMLMLRPTPLLVPIIEDGRDENDPLAQLAVQQYIAPLAEKKLDVLVLGCTHYPLLKTLIARTIGDSCKVIDSAEQCAQDVYRRLHAVGLRHCNRDELGSLRCFVTDDSSKFQLLASRFLGMAIDVPTLVSADELSERPRETIQYREAV